MNQRGKEVVTPSVNEVSNRNAKCSGCAPGAVETYSATLL